MFALAVVSLLSTVASVSMQAKAQRESARVAEKTAEYNAKSQENQAIQADMEDREAIRRERAVNATLKGEQRAAIGGSGVTAVGSPLEVLGETAGLMELNIMDSARAAEARRRSGFANAAMTRWEGSNIASGYRKQATGTILSGIGQAASSAYGLYNAGAFKGGG
jgi:hypothetical protein